MSNLICKYNVTSAGDVGICGNLNGFTDILFNGVSIFDDVRYVESLRDGNYVYTFNETGENILEFVLKDNTDIYDMSFNLCRSLISVIIPNTVTGISEEAFRFCHSLSLLEIPNSVIGIGPRAFTGCYSLTGELVIPDSVTNIGNSAFANCYGLTGELVIPDSVTNIGESVFYGCSGLTSVKISSNLGNIDRFTFANCYSLTGELVIPDSVGSIDEQAFSGCSGLTSVVIGHNVVDIGSWAFHGCVNLTSFTTHTITPPVIESTTFEGIAENGTLYFPFDINGLNYWTWLREDEYYLGYYGWNSVVIDIPEIVLFTSEVNFDYKGGVYTLRVGCKNTYDYYYVITNSFTEVGEPTIVSGATEEYDYVLDYLLTIDENTSTEKRGGWVTFYLNNGQPLADFHIIQEGNPNPPVEPDPDNPDTGTTTSNNLICKYNVTSRGDVVLCHNTSGFTDVLLDGVSIFDELRQLTQNGNINVGGYAYTFAKTGEYTIEFVLKDKTKIYDMSFYTDGYAPLISVVIPDTVTTIGNNAFAYSGILSSVTIPNSVTTIGENAFHFCSSLYTITIPSSVTTIGKGAFCQTGLYSITSLAPTAPKIDFATFYESKRNGTLYYPEGADYSSWLSTDEYYLGYYGWNGIGGDEPDEPDTPDEPDNPNPPVDPDNPDKPDNPPTPPTPDEPTGEPDIVIENIPMQYSSYGGAQNVIVRYNNISTVNEPVITSTRASGTVTITPIETLMIDEDYQRYRYTFNVDENEAEEGRTFQVTFSGDAKTKSMSLGQNANTNTATYIELNKIRMDFPSSGSSITVQANYWNTATVLEPTLSESYGTIEKINSNMAPNPKAVLYRVTLPSTSFERRLYMTFQCEDANGNTVQETLNIYQAKPEGYNEPDTEVNDNYIGYFNSLEGKPYEVRLISNPNSNEYKEILLSGENPFVVSYEGSDNIFEPIRKSTATVTVVHNTYLENLLSPYAQGTIVELYSDNKLEWSGYLTPKVYSQNWVEEYETFELEASDCIASLQYLDYQALNGKGLVTFKDIFDDIIKRSNIKGYYWPQSKICNGSYLTPSQIGVFEKNFFSNDTDEPWNLYDVLFEICQFLGLTCVQYKDALYFIDYNDSLRGDSRYDYFSTSTPIRDEFRIKDFNEVDENTFRGNDGTISFVPIYNKVIVKDNMYVCEDIIPNIFDDEKLTNIKGSFYDTYEVEPVTPYKAEYPNGSGWGKQKYKDEEVGDDIYRYFLRIYNHKDYETVYSGTTTLWGGDPVWLLQHIPHGRVVDLGVVKKDYYENHQKVIPNSVDYKRYLCIPMKHTNEVQNTGKTVFRLREGYKIPCMVSKDAFLVLKCSATFERYKWRPYINPDWKSERNKLHLPSNSETRDKIAWPMFRLRIGDKCWSGFRNRWVDLDDSHNYFETEMEWKQDKLDYWNTEIECLNQVSWEENVNESGYKIPLDGVDLNAELQFEVLCPQPSCWGRSLKNGYEYFMMEYNAYCWISDLSIKIMERGQDVDRLDNDIVYENVIDKGSISELNDMEFKLTTYSEMTKPSFSNVIMVGDTNTFLTEIQDRGLGSTGQNAEENCVERYVKQYSTPTKELSMTIANTNHNMIIPFNVMGTNYIPVSASIDYLYDRQTITMTEIK